MRWLAFAFSLFWLPVQASAAAPVAVFPLQELGEGRNDANLPFTRLVAERLDDSGNKIIGMATVISFMANNRIRSVGHLDTLNISLARRDLGAAFVLLGTISQRKERLEPSMGLTLNLVRTSDLRTVWTYVGSVSTGGQRKILGIGEPQSVAELQPLLLEEILDRWPWRIVNDEQQVGAINIDSVVLEPKYVRPGDEVRSRVRLRDTWPAGQVPRAFFKADDQLYPATVWTDGSTYEGIWIAGEENGRFPVSLLLEWPHYGRTESTLLGNYVVDGTPPLFEVEFRETTQVNGKEVFRGKLVIVPRPLIRKPLARWRLAFFTESGNQIGDMGQEGNMPEGFTWHAKDNMGSLADGSYEVLVQAWDRAGNLAEVSKWVEMNRSLPRVDLVVDRKDEEMVVALEHDGKVPLAYWRMEMWTREGKILTRAEGKDLPMSIEVKMPGAGEDQEIQGVLVARDVLGNRFQQKVEDLLPKLGKRAEAEAEAKAGAEKKKSSGISESWVDEF